MSRTRGLGQPRAPEIQRVCRKPQFQVPGLASLPFGWGHCVSISHQSSGGVNTGSLPSALAGRSENRFFTRLKPARELGSVSAREARRHAGHGEHSRRLAEVGECPPTTRAKEQAEFRPQAKRPGDQRVPPAVGVLRRDPEQRGHQGRQRPGNASEQRKRQRATRCMCTVRWSHDGYGSRNRLLERAATACRRPHGVSCFHSSRREEAHFSRRKGQSLLTSAPTGRNRISLHCLRRLLLLMQRSKRIMAT
jgi:hypothetical protein